MKQNYRAIFGVLLILAGVLLIGQEFGIIGGGWDEIMLGLAFGAGSFFFATMFLVDRSRWWAALVAFIFLGLAASQLIEVFLPSASGSIIGGTFLGLTGLGFLAIYFLDRTMWWAIIPAGVLVSLTAVTIVEDIPTVSGFESGGLLFLGLGLTFLVLYFLPVQGSRLTWAIYPALSLLVFGILIGFAELEAWAIIWPSMIIVAGLAFIIGAFRR